MADTVAFVLEAMVPELEDFHVRGLFTRTEIQRIVAQRTAHEYAMKRRAPDKTDFLRAIEVRRRVCSSTPDTALTRAHCLPALQYEEQVESLRRHRKKLQNAVLAEEEAAVAQHQAGGQQGSKQSRGPQQQRRSQSGAGDHSIVRRIHFLYTRALRKFRGDLRLWVRRQCSCTRGLLIPRLLTHVITFCALHCAFCL
jgi:U3 small nucleolar RNA-associated protein 6